MNPPHVLPRFISDKFRFWSLMSMVLLVFVHGYNQDVRYLQPWTLPTEPLDANGFVQYLFANGLLRFRIPMLFAISGYLFALHDARPHAERIRTRTRTLLVPYLLWSGLWLATLFGAEQFALVREGIAASGIAQLDREGVRVLVSDHTPGELLARWLLAPFAYQLWFIRVLFFYNLAYPLLARALTSRNGTRVLFGIALLMWLTTTDLFFVEGEGLLFFSLGIWLQKRGRDLALPPPGPLAAWAAVFVGAALAKTWLAFAGQPLLGDAVYPLLLWLHKLTVASGLVTAWFGGDALVRAAMRRPWFVRLTAFSFVIYAFHAPLVAILIDPALALFGGGTAAHAIAFVALPLALVAMAVALGAGLRAVAPNLSGLLTGGRGLARPVAS